MLGKRSTKVLLSLLLLSVAAFHSARAEDDEAVADSDGVEDDEYADVERAHLVVRKFVKDAMPFGPGENSPISGLVVQGRNVTITIDLFNAGAVAANNVVLKDTLPPNATLVDGTLTADIGKITVGSHIYHTYTVVFTSGNTFAPLPAAVVTYVAEAESTSTQDSYSTSYGLFVMTPVQQIQKYALKVGVYASLGFARTVNDWRNLAIVVGIFLILVSANWATKRFKALGVNRRREKALKELEKNE